MEGRVVGAGMGGKQAGTTALHAPTTHARARLCCAGGSGALPAQRTSRCPRPTGMQSLHVAWQRHLHLHPAGSLVGGDVARQLQPHERLRQANGEGGGGCAQPRPRQPAGLMRAASTRPPRTRSIRFGRGYEGFGLSMPW